MTCVYPVYIKSKDLLVPCGKCLLCRINKSREWSFRLMLHAESCNFECSFITLTYDDDHLPKDLQIHRKELQDFFKRFRYSLDGKRIKYFACGEYGGVSGRPHYHAIIFGLDPFYFQGISTEIPTKCRSGYMIKIPQWDKGLVHVAPVCVESIYYVARYLLKKVGTNLYNSDTARCQFSRGCKHYACDLRYPINPPFQLSSQKLGLNGFMNKFFKPENMERYDSPYCEEPGKENYFTFTKDLTFDGKRMSVPRYFVRAFGLRFEEREDDAYKKLCAEYSKVISMKPSGFRTKRLDYLEKELDNYSVLNYQQKRLDIVSLQSRFI